MALLLEEQIGSPPSYFPILLVFSSKHSIPNDRWHLPEEQSPTLADTHCPNSGYTCQKTNPQFWQIPCAESEAMQAKRTLSPNLGRYPPPLINKRLCQPQEAQPPIQEKTPAQTQATLARRSQKKQKLKNKITIQQIKKFRNMLLDISSPKAQVPRRQHKNTINNCLDNM